MKHQKQSQTKKDVFWARLSKYVKWIMIRIILELSDNGWYFMKIDNIIKLKKWIWTALNLFLGNRCIIGFWMTTPTLHTPTTSSLSLISHSINSCKLCYNKKSLFFKQTVRLLLSHIKIYYNQAIIDKNSLLKL